jgi:hypothetical protein
MGFVERGSTAGNQQAKSDQVKVGIGRAAVLDPPPPERAQT